MESDIIVVSKEAKYEYIKNYILHLLQHDFVVEWKWFRKDKFALYLNKNKDHTLNLVS